MLHSVEWKVEIFLTDIIRYSLFDQGAHLDAILWEEMSNKALQVRLMTIKAYNQAYNQSIQSAGIATQIPAASQPTVCKRGTGQSSGERQRSSGHRLHGLKHVKNDLISSSLFHCNLIRYRGSRQRPRPIVTYYH